MSELTAAQSRQKLLGKYITGFVLSIIFTLTAYILVQAHVNSHGQTLSRNMLLGIIAVLAIVQFVVQLVFFLHLSFRAKERWQMLVFWFMIGVVFILVGGSIWIMSSLNYRMTPTQMNEYLKSQDSL